MSRTERIGKYILSQIIVPHVPPLFRATFVNKGDFGKVFSIDVDIRIENPFQTFCVAPDNSIAITSDNRSTQSPDESPDAVHRFCCKLVFITSIDQANSFVTEGMKQGDIYAKTNNFLNAVCLPVFFCGVFSDIPGDPVSMFIRSILSVSTCEYDSSIQYGISFMPYSVNNLQLFTVPASLQPFTTAESILRGARRELIETINMWVDYRTNPPSQNYPNDPSIIEMFQTKPRIYSCVLVISLIMRLYLEGYCHGDLHLGNMIIYYSPSGMTRRSNSAGQMVDIYLYPSLLIIDAAFAFRHGFATHAIETYAHFKTFLRNVTSAMTPRTGYSMIGKNPFYHWFPEIFMDFIRGEMDTEDRWVINENRCKFIFHLFQRFETFRTTFEVQQSDVAKEIAPDMIEAIIDGNATAIAEVDAYIASIPGGTPAEQLHKFNIHGGRRRRIYNAIKRKQTKNTKKHSRNRNRSLTRSRSRSRRRRGPTKLK